MSRRFSKKRIMCFLLMISILLLLFYVFVMGKEETDVLLKVQHRQDGSIEISLLEQKHIFGSQVTLRGDEYRVFETKLQEIRKRQEELEQSGEQPENGFFLPGYIDLSEVYVVFSQEDGSEEVFGDGTEEAFLDGTEEAFLDDKVLDTKGVTGIQELSEGAHTLCLGDEKISFQIVKGSQLPVVCIDTETGMEYVHEDKENMTQGEIRILSKAGLTEYMGELESLRGRGNSSWYMLKKSYNIKLAGQASLLDMPAGRSWVLQGGALDKTALRNKIFMDMAKQCGLKNAVEAELVDLYLDGEYYGCYLLSEKIAVATGRLEIGDLEEKNLLLNEGDPESYGRYQIDEDMGKKGYLFPNNPKDISGGYLLEIETYRTRYGWEPGGFITRNDFPIVIKEPSYASAAQVEYIASYVQDFETALYSEDGYNEKGAYYLDYMDMESFAVRYLVDEISKNIDAGYSSYFFYKPQGDEKLYAGPVWDYDTAWGNNNGWGNSEELQNPEGFYVNRTNWSEQLWKKEEFRQATKQLFKERFEPYLTGLVEQDMDAYIEEVYDSVKMEALLQGKEEPDKAFEQMKDFVAKRTEYLKTNYYERGNENEKH